MKREQEDQLWLAMLQATAEWTAYEAKLRYGSAEERWVRKQIAANAAERLRSGLAVIKCHAK